MSETHKNNLKTSWLMTKASEILRSDQKIPRPKILYVPSTSPSVIWLFAFLQIRSVWIIQLNLPVSKIVLLCKASQLSFLIGLFLSFRVYNLLVADIMKTNLFYISYHTKYADLKALLEKSNHRSYPLVDSEGTAIILRSSFILILLSNRCFYWCLWVFGKTHNFFMMKALSLIVNRRRCIGVWDQDVCFELGQIHYVVFVAMGKTLLLWTYSASI